MWSTTALQKIGAGLKALVAQLEGGKDRFKQIFGGTTFVRKDEVKETGREPGPNGTIIIKYAAAETEGSTISFFNKPNTHEINLGTAAEQTVHELGHVWNNRTGGMFSSGIAKATGSIQSDPLRHEGGYEFNPPGANVTDLADNNDWEDWAEALTVTIYPAHGNKSLDNMRSAYVSLRLRPSQRHYGGR